MVDFILAQTHELEAKTNIACIGFLFLQQTQPLQGKTNLACVKFVSSTNTSITK